MFSQASVILLTGGCLPQCMLGYTPPWSRPPWNRHPPEQTPPWEQTPPRADPPRADTPQEWTPPSPQPPGSRHSPHRACWEIRSMRGQYASYWNAILCFYRCVSDHGGGVCLSACWDTPPCQADPHAKEPRRPPCQGDHPPPRRPPTKEPRRPPFP